MKNKSETSRKFLIISYQINAIQVLLTSQWNVQWSFPVSFNISIKSNYAAVRATRLGNKYNVIFNLSRPPGTAFPKWSDYD